MSETTTATKFPHQYNCACCEEPAQPGRRRFFKLSAVVAASASSAAALSQTVLPSTSGMHSLERQISNVPLSGSGRILIKGGTVVSMDPAVGNFETADVLIEGSKIVAIRPNIQADAQVIDASGMIVHPGMHDTHRHSWQGQLRRLLPNADIGAYFKMMHLEMAPFYRPEDVYLGNYITALSNINCGITGLLDYSHIRRSPEHADAAVLALMDSGIRAVYACAQPVSKAAGVHDGNWLPDLARLKRQHFSSADQLVTLRMGTRDLNEKDIRYTRDLDIGTSADAVFGKVPGSLFVDSSPKIVQLAKAGLLGPDITLIHCTDLDDAAWKAIADTGTTVSLAPTSDAQYMLMSGATPIAKALEFGVKPSLSVDADVGLSQDMWTQMRTVLMVQRLAVAQARKEEKKQLPKPLTVRDVFEYATVAGAQNNGVLSKSGTLTPGKEADIVLIRPDELGLNVNNVFGAIVMGTDAGSVETVLIGGKIRKWKGTLVGVDMRRLQTRALQSTQFLFEKIHFKNDIFA